MSCQCLFPQPRSVVGMVFCMALGRVLWPRGRSAQSTSAQVSKATVVQISWPNRVTNLVMWNCPSLGKPSCGREVGSPNVQSLQWMTLLLRSG
ncbi:hypothetical protein B0H67DRAFT_560954 [Lasiosphaeris hirsuta]|uniref:Uncharacterized protein n=1 Tax=Lasiosphaeris hirsuta TaxID=260670 RepID=A0AA40B9J1_9PEZI|nr:hypothetical protein B0H67DRAFT_560954 [Lasiosphaeris hirsuta]